MCRSSTWKAYLFGELVKLVCSFFSNIFDSHIVSLRSHYNLIIILKMLKEDTLIYSDVTWKSWHFRSLATQSLLNSLCYIIKNIKAQLNWSFTCGFPSQGASNVRVCPYHDLIIPEVALEWDREHCLWVQLLIHSTHMSLMCLMQ